MKPHIQIDLARQDLQWTSTEGEVRRFSVSTAAAGAGELRGSERTPRGRHIVRAKIGADAPWGAVFVGRRHNGEIYSPELGAQFPQRDWILTRILWLSGSEVGRNRLGNVDSMRRYIYIHGTPEEWRIGRPASYGCIRMRSRDIIDLYQRVKVGTPVTVTPGYLPAYY